jgi:hypothetical protein
LVRWTEIGSGRLDCLALAASQPGTPHAMHVSKEFAEPTGRVADLHNSTGRRVCSRLRRVPAGSSRF